MYYNDILGFTFLLILWDIVFYILNKIPIDEYENYILITFCQTHLLYIFSSHNLYISNCTT